MPGDGMEPSLPIGRVERLIAKEFAEPENASVRSMVHLNFLESWRARQWKAPQVMLASKLNDRLGKSSCAMPMSVFKDLQGDF